MKTGHGSLHFFAWAVFCGLQLCGKAAEAPQEVVALRAFGALQPRVSPDGSAIALSFQGIIAVMPAAGGRLTCLSQGEGWDVEPAWSPDAQRIAYVNAPDFTSGELRLLRRDNGERIVIPHRVRARGPLYFHPEGRRVLGQFSLSGPPDRIAWCDLETGAVTPVSMPTTVSNRAAYALSQNGRWIVFSAHQDIPGEQTGMNGPQADLWQLPVEGGPAEKLVRFPARVYALYGDANDAGIYFVSDLGTSHHDVWHLPLTGPEREPRKVSFGQADEDWPSISRDGRVLIHTENHEEATALVRYDPHSGERRTLALDRLDRREPTGTLRLQVWDADTGFPAVARVSLRRRDGKFHAPLGALYRITSGLGHFYCRQPATLEMPAGRYELIAARGLEYREYHSQFDVKAGETNTLTVELERWTDMAGRGWYSGENHVHANYGYGAWYNTPRATLDLCEGEDLNVGNIMVANSDGDGVFDREFFRGQPDGHSGPRTIIYWNEEFRSTLWGHLTLINLRQLVEPIFTGFKDTTNPWDVPTNADIAEQTHAQRAAVSYTHPASIVDSPYDSAYSAKGLPVDAALGRIDTLDVMGGGYDASVILWYRLLNCGFKLPAAAGTDCFLNRIVCAPPGWGRTYVHLTNGLSYRAWIAGQLAGNSFISKGPMLEFSVENLPPGSTLAADAPRSVRVAAKAWSQYPLEKLELIQNGAVVGQGELSSNRLAAMLERTLRFETSGWLAVRTSGPSPPREVARFNVAGGPAAHSNPVFITIRDRPLNAKADAEYFLKWIDRLEQSVRWRGRIPSGWEHVEAQFSAARAVYQRLAKDGAGASQ